MSIPKRLVGLVVLALAAWLLGGPLYRRLTRPKHLTDEVIHAAQTGDLVTVALAAPRNDQASKAFFQALLSYSPDILLRKDGKGYTLLHWAVTGCNEETAMTLIAMKAEIGARDNAGQTPLHLASHASARFVGRLIEAGADVGARDNEGRTPLHTVLAPNPIAALLEHGADANVRDNDGKTPLHYVLFDKPAILLLHKKADVNAADNKGLTPLHMAVIHNRQDLAQLLLSEGADVNLRDKAGKTPLHHATRWNQYDLAILLREHGANGKIPDNDGQLATYAQPIMVCTCNTSKLIGGAESYVGSHYVRVGEQCGKDRCEPTNAFLR
jgi:ankyrin repeat protein